jgi:hypothetical protein
MGGHRYRERSARDECDLRRDVMIEKKWREKMQKSMKRFDHL